MSRGGRAPGQAAPPAKPAGARPPGRLGAIALLCLGVAAVGPLAWLDARSELAGRLRAGSTITAWLLLSPAGQTKSPRPGEEADDLPAERIQAPRPAEPALYLLAYDPASRSLELVHVPADTGRTVYDALKRRAGRAGAPWKSVAAPDFQGAAAEAAARLLRPDPAGPRRDVPLALTWRLGDPDVHPDRPESVKEWLARWPKDATFWARLPGVVRWLRRSSSPPLGAYDAALLAMEARRLSGRRVRISALPGPEGAARLLSRVFADGQGAPLPGRPYTVQILNASGVPGVALQATKVLRWRGEDFDVVDFGNASSEAGRTRVLDRTGAVRPAEEVAEALGCGEAEVMSRIEPGPRAAVTVVLGRDYALCSAIPPAEDLRR